jgi:hypothetical protein
MEKVKLYIGCCLTSAPEAYKRRIELLKDEFRKHDFVEILDFLPPLPGEAQSRATPRDVYHNDIHGCVGVAHVMIAEVSLPSTGLGQELGTAIEKHSIRVMMCATKRSRVSRLTLGAAEHEYNPSVTFKHYNKSIIELLPYFLKEIALLYAMQN